MIRIREVIAILDAGVLSESGDCAFLELARQGGRLEKISADEVKSYVITYDRVFASPISSTTLKKRADSSQTSWK
jgi:hypothetical protein